MPTYEYSCSKCGHQFELFQSMSDQPITSCPKSLCKLKRWGRGTVKRAISGGAGLIFKGSGFYITDYRSDSYKEAAKKDTAPTNGKSSTAKTDATPATTPTSKPESKSESKSETKPAPAKPAAAT
jgi:putative FmdB family regulatory protein